MTNTPKPRRKARHEDLAKSCGISRSYFTNIMNGKKDCRSLALALRIFDVTGERVGDLKGLNDKAVGLLRGKVAA